jgi:uncharacterized protein (TIGR02284 family)
MNPVDTLTFLNRLIVTTKNGESTLEAAAQEAHHAELKSALEDYAQFFHKAAEDLTAASQRLGGHPHPRASFDNTLHRFMMHLRALAYGRNETTILEDVEQEESLADELYADVPNWDLPDDVRALVMRQGEMARKLHDNVHALRARLLH